MNFLFVDQTQNMSFVIHSSVADVVGMLLIQQQKQTNVSCKNR